MSGGVVSSSDRKLSGWACLAEQSAYPVTVHLVAQTTILQSALAEGVCPENARAGGEQLSRLSCWFDFDLSDVETGPESSLRVVIGETGECIYAADSRAAPDASRDVAPARTYRDAFASGLSVTDVMKVLYLDILRRPADVSGLAYHVSRWETGQLSLEHMRRSLLMSDEYGGRRKQLRDAAGNAFRRDVTLCGAEAVLAFEPLFTAFSEDDLPLPTRLIRFFPGLLARGTALKAAQKDAAQGLQEREVFFRTLSRLANRPALVIDPCVLHSLSADITDSERDPGGLMAAVVDVPCSSPLFFSGWHKLEGTSTEPCRWMRQIGVIRNPQPRRSLQRIEVEITTCYADADALFAASDSEPLTVVLQDIGGQRRIASVTSERGGFETRHLVLVSAKATSPFRHEASPDPRLLSIQASQTRFVYVEGANP